jgi:glycine/D-amino acid oxidase-like deaminating enzyme
VSAPDVAVVGGGIVGCSLAALLAEGGASVRLYERDEVAAAASGRNSGSLQHPMDEALTGLHEASLRLYAGLGHGFELPAEPAGVLVVSDDRAALEADVAELSARFPELATEWLEGVALVEAEPALAPGLAAYRLATGFPVPPAAAARAWAERARAAGADLRVGAAVDRIEIRDGRVAGVIAGGETEPAGAVVVAAGPWTPPVIDPAGSWRPIAALWGVVADVRMAAPPVHMLEQAGVEELTSPAGAGGWIFSAVTLNRVSAIGSTFLPTEPDAAATAPQVLERAMRFLPGLVGAETLAVRACPRPQSLDGRPLLGPLGGIEGLHVASGHGPWGISLGPGSAALVADAILGRGEAIPAELAASRLGAPGAAR